MHRAPTDEEIRRFILRHLGSGLAPPTMPDDWPLGEAGAGLDSIALVELIVACEVEFGVPLLEVVLQGPVTIAAIAGAVRAATPAGQ